MCPCSSADRGICLIVSRDGEMRSEPIEWTALYAGTPWRASDTLNRRVVQVTISEDWVIRRKPDFEMAWDPRETIWAGVALSLVQPADSRLIDWTVRET